MLKEGGCGGSGIKEEGVISARDSTEVGDTPEDGEEISQTSGIDRKTCY